MKKLAIGMLTIGLLSLCGCDNSQLVSCQKENVALKMQVDKAQADIAAATSTTAIAPASSIG